MTAAARKAIAAAAAVLICVTSLLAQDNAASSAPAADTPTPELTLETATVKKRLINDYSLIGVNYGVNFSSMYYSPSKHNRAMVFSPGYFSITYTKYSKMFDTLPYFGLVIGMAHGHEGFAFKRDPETGESQNVDGAENCRIEVYEFPAMAQIHVDTDPIKFMANAGVYGGWRKNIERSGPILEEQYATSFRDYERQLDYGFQGGAGIALMLDPVEIHFNCLIRWSWSSIYAPDYASKYYYNYAYPLDIMATVGINFQLTKRSGRTNSEIRKDAYNKVYGKVEDTSGKNR